MDEGEGTRGGDAEGVHGFGAEVLSDGRAEHREPVCGAREWRPTGALELELVIYIG